MKDHIFLFALLLYSFTLGAQCFPDRHNTSSTAAWISCEQSENPNAVRGNSHWIRYNLNAVYSLGQMTFWNYNRPGDLDQGLQEIIIDYSLDGIEWIEWGTFTVDQASGSSIYEGDEGPDLEGLNAKDILITAVSNYGHNSCFALSEIKIEVEELISTNKEIVDTVDFVLSPNPTSDKLKLSLNIENSNTPINFSIVNLTGKLLQKGEIQNSANSIEHTVDVSRFQAGNYFIELLIDGTPISKPFTVTR